MSISLLSQKPRQGLKNIFVKSVHEIVRQWNLSIIYWARLENGIEIICDNQSKRGWLPRGGPASWPCPPLGGRGLPVVGRVSGQDEVKDEECGMWKGAMHGVWKQNFKKTKTGQKK